MHLWVNLQSNCAKPFRHVAGGMEWWPGAVGPSWLVPVFNWDTEFQVGNLRDGELTQPPVALQRKYVCLVGKSYCKPQLPVHNDTWLIHYPNRPHANRSKHA